MTIQRLGLTKEQASNSFSNEELEGMSYGDSPVANAYRELLAFRRHAEFREHIHNNDDTLSELHRLAEEATEGEWEAVNNGAFFGVVRLKGTHSQIAACTMPDDTPRLVPPLEANSRYIAAAHPAVILGLVERLKRLERLAEASKFLVKAEADGSPNGAFKDGIDWVINEAKDLS